MECLWLEKRYVQLLKCPKCGQEMESGYLNILAPSGRLFLPPVVVMNWKDDSKEHSDRLMVKRSFLGVNLWM